MPYLQSSNLFTTIATLAIMLLAWLVIDIVGQKKYFSQEKKPPRLLRSLAAGSQAGTWVTLLCLLKVLWTKPPSWLLFIAVLFFVQLATTTTILILCKFITKTDWAYFLYKFLDLMPLSMIAPGLYIASLFNTSLFHSFFIAISATLVLGLPFLALGVIMVKKMPKHLQS